MRPGPPRRPSPLAAPPRGVLRRRAAARSRPPPPARLPGAPADPPGAAAPAARAHPFTDITPARGHRLPCTTPAGSATSSCPRRWARRVCSSTPTGTGSWTCSWSTRPSRGTEPRARAPRCALYRSIGEAARSASRTPPGGGPRPPLYGMGCAVADFDGDGDPDMYVTALGDNVLWRNDGDGTSRTSPRGRRGGRSLDRPRGAPQPEWSTAAAFRRRPGRRPGPVRRQLRAWTPGLGSSPASTACTRPSRRPRLRGSGVPALPEPRRRPLRGRHRARRARQTRSASRWASRSATSTTTAARRRRGERHPAELPFPQPGRRPIRGLRRRGAASPTTRPAGPAPAWGSTSRPGRATASRRWRSATSAASRCRSTAGGRRAVPGRGAEARLAGRDLRPLTFGLLFVD